MLRYSRKLVQQAMADTFVIIGGAHAGGRAAATLRTEGFKGQIVVVGNESHRPYNRPPLSKGYLQGTEGLDAVYLEPADFYKQHNIELRSETEATAIDPAARTVALSKGGSLSYDKLLITTGSEPRHLPGPKPQGLFYLRGIDDSDAIQKAVSKGTKVAVIGGSWIACEVAASLIQRGAKVELLIRGDAPFEKILGAEVGKIFTRLHTDKGVSVRTAAEVSGFSDDPVAGVKLANGETVACEVTVAGVGITPRTELATAASLTVEDGIFTNEFFETSAEHVYAAGDVASVHYPFYSQNLRVEHWDAAEHQGPIAAKNMLGKRETYDKLPYFFSDQYDFSFEYVGHAPDWDEVIVRGTPEQYQFAALYLKDGRLAAGFTAGLDDVPSDAIEALVRSKKSVGAEELLSKDLKKLAS